MSKLTGSMFGSKLIAYLKDVIVATITPSIAISKTDSFLFGTLFLLINFILV